MASGPYVAANLSEAERLIEVAANQGAKLVALPEYFALMGFKETDKVAAREEEGKGPIQQFLKSMAKKHKIWLVGGSVPLVSNFPNKVRNSVKRGEGSLNGQLQWAGNPYDFNPVEINGNLQLEMKKGQILKVQPGVGRLLGLLSLQSLPRRLSLDFRDLFSNGFAFDKIKASAKINSGVIYSDDFVMSGPAADVSIKGETNLQKETQHLYVKVLPHISDSLSLAALAGGPLAGAVAFLAQKILKDPLNKISSTEYEIIGTWDNPQEVKNNKEDTEAPAN